MFAGNVIVRKILFIICGVHVIRQNKYCEKIQISIQKILTWICKETRILSFTTIRNRNWGKMELCYCIC